MVFITAITLNVKEKTMKKILPLAILSVAMLATIGCRSKQDSELVGDIDEFGITEISDADSGLSLFGAPFNETMTRVDDVMVSPVYFGYDSSYLPPSESVKLEQVAQILLSNPKFALIVEGHCDERGSNEYNLSLGEQRALTLREQLTMMGVDPNRIQTRSFGEEKPAVFGSGESAWSQNRRGEFAFYR